jgi:hypothetical protein
MTKFSLPGDDAPVTVELAVPAGWKLTPTADGPQWGFDGALMLLLTAVSPRGDDDAARVDRAIQNQYREVAPGERTDLSGGRAWVQRKDGDNVHARMFVPYAGGVVMGVAVLDAGGAKRLSEVKAAFETIEPTA